MSRVLAALCMLGVLLVAGCSRPAPVFHPADEPVPVGAQARATVPTPSALPGPPPLALHGANSVTGQAAWWSWSLLDRRTGQVWGSPNQDEVTRSVSMIKFWLAALYLRQHPAPSPAMVTTLRSMIRDSNNDAADTVHRALGGNAPVIAAMESVCGVTGPYIPAHYWWASTNISPHSAVQLGDCLAAGRVADPQWTDWLLGEMRAVRGGGDFGVRWAFPDEVRPTIAIKNGWNVEQGVWYVNCLAIGDDWVLAVESRSAAFATGADLCVSVTRQLLDEPVRR